MKKHSDVDVLISFASLRSAFDSTMETLQYPQVSAASGCEASNSQKGRRRNQYGIFWPDLQIHTIAIIAEGIPEAHTRKIIKAADEKGVTIIGPATVRTPSPFATQA